MFSLSYSPICFMPYAIHYTKERFTKQPLNVGCLSDTNTGMLFVQQEKVLRRDIMKK